MPDSNITHIALLRGINVGGHRVKMDRLRELFRELGFEDVRSFIQTGNVFFHFSETDLQTLQKRVAEHLENALVFKVPVCLRTLSQLERIVALNPFKHRTLTPDTRFSVTFLDREIESNLAVPSFTRDGGFELIHMTRSELFVIWHLKQVRPANSQGFDRDVEAHATTRFWHTTEKILAAAKATPTQ